MNFIKMIELFLTILQLILQHLFLWPQKNPNKLFYASTKPSIIVYENGGFTKVNGRFAEFLETSTCELDCSLSGNCMDNKCSCFTNYYGPTCKLFCSSNTCSSHGSCNATTGDCICDPFWTGKQCATPILTPPIFPAAFTVRSVQFNEDDSYNEFFDYQGQRRKFQYLPGNNVTELYTIGYSYTVTPDGLCTVATLDDSGLDLWRVDPNAVLVEINIACATSDLCSYWQLPDSSDEWLVTLANLPVRIVQSGQEYSYDPKMYTVQQPDASVWQLPSACGNLTLTNQ